MTIYVYAFGNEYPFDDDIAISLGLGSKKNDKVEIKLHKGFQPAFDYIYYTLHGNTTVLDPIEADNIVIIANEFNIDVVLNEIADLINDNVIPPNYFSDMHEYEKIPIIYDALCLAYIRQNSYYDKLSEPVQDYFDTNSLSDLSTLHFPKNQLIFFNIYDVDIQPDFKLSARMLNIISTMNLYISPYGFYIYARSADRDYIVTNNYEYSIENNLLIVKD